MKKYVSFCKKFNQIMLGIGVTLLVAVTLITFIQVLQRNFLGTSWTWAEELTRYLVIYAVYFASGSVMALEQNARVDIFYSMFPKNVQRILNSLFYLLTTIFLAVMLYYGYVYVSRNMTIWCASVRIPWGIPFASLMVGAVNMLLQVPAKFYELWAPAAADEPEPEN